jgi:hypothetical protein
MKIPPALERAAHPLTLGAAALVFLNDLLLRPLMPGSWWTGKLSTLGAAFALPILLAACLALLFPHRARFWAALSFGAVLTALLLLKATPETNRLLTSWLPVRAVPDPGDLLAVIPWAAALFFWFRPAVSFRRLFRFRLLLLPFAAIFLLADAAAPDYGVGCLVRYGETGLLARAGYITYLSNDSGQSWIETELPLLDQCIGPSTFEPGDLILQDGTHFRFTPGESIQRSADGQTWQPVYLTAGLSEPELDYINRTINTNLVYRPAPLDAVVAPGGQHLVVAMGVEGVLIVSPTGETAWYAVGPFRRDSLRHAGINGLLTILAGEIWLAAGAAIFCLANALRKRRSAWVTVLTIFGWTLLGGSALLQHPDYNTGYLAPLASLSLLAACLWAAVLLALALFHRRGASFRATVRLAWMAPLLAVLIFLPYVAWGLRWLPMYWIALAAAAVLTVLGARFMSLKSAPAPTPN